MGRSTYSTERQDVKIKEIVEMSKRPKEETIKQHNNGIKKLSR